MKTAQMLALAMLLGSAPFSYIAVYLKSQGTARDSGGTLTNIRRTWGAPGLVVVITLNIAKGFVPVYLTKVTIGSLPVAIIAGVIAILSHNYPYWLMFRKSGWGGSVAIGAAVGLLFFL